jgi:flagellar motor switch protein FliM
MGLQVGDVLVLDTRTEAQLTGQIAGQERLLGRPGRIGKKAGFLVERVLPPGKTLKDRE